MREDRRRMVGSCRLNDFENRKIDARSHPASVAASAAAWPDHLQMLGIAERVRGSATTPSRHTVPVADRRRPASIETRCGAIAVARRDKSSDSPDNATYRF